jgi:hypothetical protein
MPQSKSAANAIETGSTAVRALAVGAFALGAAAIGAILGQNRSQRGVVCLADLSRVISQKPVSGQQEQSSYTGHFDFT